MSLRCWDHTCNLRSVEYIRSGKRRCRASLLQTRSSKSVSLDCSRKFDERLHLTFAEDGLKYDIQSIRRGTVRKRNDGSGKDSGASIRPLAVSSWISMDVGWRWRREEKEMVTVCSGWLSD